MAKGRFEDDGAILGGCVAGDEDAWRALVARYTNLMSIAIRRRLKTYTITLPPADIDDIRQNVLESLWKSGSLRQVRSADSLSYWLAMCCGNAAVDYMRKKRHLDPPASLPMSIAADGPDIIDLIPSPDPGPQEHLDADEMSRIIAKAIELLPVKERLIMKLRLVHDKKCDEIAELLHLPRGTVLSYMKRARERLKKYLKNLQ
jgi:RNA polymerase sigma-70 factor (ECF subfamily)